jgi:photosystem II stability/assembly factor-like uncharacterized protein
MKPAWMKMIGVRIAACAGIVVVGMFQEAGAQWVKNKLPYSKGSTITALTVGGNYLFAGTEGSGVFLSADSGSSWNVSNSGLTDLEIYSSAIIGSNILVCTNSGIFRSTNNGESWILIYGSAVNAFEVISGIIFASSTYYGLLHSIDSGSHWTAINAGLPANVYIPSIAMNGNNIFVGIGGTSPGFYRSIDSGATWITADSGISNLYVASLAVTGNLIFAGMSFGGLYRSEDTGKTWAAADAGLPEVEPLPEDETVYALAVSGTTLFAGLDTSVYRSLDVSPLPMVSFAASSRERYYIS